MLAELGRKLETAMKKLQSTTLVDEEVGPTHVYQVPKWLSGIAVNAQEMLLNVWLPWTGCDRDAQ